ncbi:N-acetylmuramoyl-L-alanine amidase [Telmatospirillum sp. J64-1]|uniref:N-acetylmuramoyl-L-alanine amidase n=1 Tax=Telmatospirillum sp. J64-1 TaxID=2502183 RepID=UPI00163D795A|nr:N-acetylmuramoyl-L-alanine amidase [Telmatospirillum sp. J64-1]
MTVFVLSGLTTAFTPAWAKPAVTALRAGDHQTKTRFVLDLSDKIDFRVFTLVDPYRVVIDLPEIDWKAQTTLPQPVGHIANLRYGLFRPGTGRLVLDLSRPSAVQAAFVIPPRDGFGWRFVLDLENSTEQAMRNTPVPADAGQPTSPAGAQAALAAEAKVAAAVPLPNPARPAKPVVVIDPGHGGVDPGAIGVSGLYEKDLTLAMGRLLKAELEKTGRYQVVLTRDRDIFIPLRERVAIARRAGGELFISLHADSHNNRSLRGLSVYTLSERASDAEAAALAEKENKADLIGGLDLSHESPEVSSILLDLTQRETMNLSAGFAGKLIEDLGKEVTLLRNTHRFAGFAVLKAPDIPSVLVELGYLSNREDERLLRQDQYRAKLARTLARSVDRYFTQIQKARGS